MLVASEYTFSLSIVLIAGMLASVAPNARSAQAEEFPAVDCVIGPYQIVDLSSPVPGVIDRLLVERSQFVRRGQVVAELAAGVERAAVALARARAQVEPEINVWQVNLDFDERRKARMQSLHESRAISDDNKDEAEREAELSSWKLQQARDLKNIRRLELERAEEQLKQKIIRSPIDGFVLEKLKSPGEYVEDQAIVRIAQLDPLKVEAIVPIELFGKIPLGMTAEVHPETLAEGTRPALVTVVDRAGDAGSGTFGVRLEMPNPDYQLPAGLKCDLRFVPGTGKSSGGFSAESASRSRASGSLSDADQSNNEHYTRWTDADLPNRDSDTTVERARSEPVTERYSGDEELIANASTSGGRSVTNITSEAEGQAENLSAAVAPDYHPIRLSGGKDRKRPATSIPDAASQESDPVAVDADADAEAEDLVNNEISDTEGSELDSEATVRSVVYRIGPLNSRKELRQLERALNQEGIAYQLDEDEVEESQGYIVLLPASASVAEGKSLRNEIKQSGVTDLVLVRVGDYINRVSAGVYGRYANAVGRRDHLRELGYRAEVVERARKISRWWLDITLNGANPEEVAFLEEKMGRQFTAVAGGIPHE